MPIRPGERLVANKPSSPYVPAVNTEYDRQYKENLFLVWYQANRPRGKKFTAIIPKDEIGRVPNLSIVQKWMREDGWQERANEMDGEVRKKLHDIAIEQKVKMHQRHAEIGVEIMEKGLEYLEANSLQSAAEAARLIDLGQRMEQENTGGAQALAEMSKLTDKKLLDLIADLSSQMPEEAPILEGEFAEVE